VVENNSKDPKTFAYYETMKSENPAISVVTWKNKEFNYAAINNFGVSYAKGEYILLLNNDVEMIEKIQ
jgi:GT2 family glycosyltransferase